MSHWKSSPLHIFTTGRRVLVTGAFSLAMLAVTGHAAVAATDAGQAGAIEVAAVSVDAGTAASDKVGSDIGILSAYGVQTWGSFCWNGKCFPSGILEHSITGSGRTITYHWAEAESASNICNWRIDFNYYKTDGTRYLTQTGPTNYTCTRVARRTNGTDITLPYYGRACASILSNSIRLATQCHSITA